MTDQRPVTTPEAGWYPHPDGGTQLRWWNGALWTDQYAAAVAEPASLVDPSAPQATAPMDPGPRWGTVWVWLLAFSPWLATAATCAAVWVYALNPDQAWMWVAVILVPHALVVGAAVMDSLRLRQREHRAVPHWAWSLLGAPVYLIARAVAARGTRPGTTPLWVALGNVLLSWFMATVGLYAIGALFLWVIGQMFEASPY